MVIISVSISEKQAKWCKNQPKGKESSPSWLLQKAIHEAMEQDGDVLFETNTMLRKKVQLWMEQAHKQREFMTEKGVHDEYLKI